MSHDDLERRLRAEPGRHDSGYRALPMPRTLEARERRPRIGLLALLAGTVLAGATTAILLILLIGVPGRQPVGEAPLATPGPTASTATLAPTATPAGSDACTATDATTTAERWGGAAGSRGTILTIALADGAMPCELAGQVEVRMATRAGELLVAGLSGGANHGTLPLDRRTTYSLGVSWSNWCGEQPIGAHVELRLGASDPWIAVETPQGGADPVPPCLGSGQPTSLGLSELEAQPAP